MGIKNNQISKVTNELSQKIEQIIEDEIGSKRKKKKNLKTNIPMEKKAVKDDGGIKPGGFNILSNWYRNYPYEMLYIAERYTHYMKLSSKFEVVEQEEFKELSKETPCIVLSSDYIKSSIITLEGKIASKDFQNIMNFKVKTLYSASILSESIVKWTQIDTNRYLVNLVPKKVIQQYEEYFGVVNMPVIASDILGIYNYALYKNQFTTVHTCYVSMSIMSTQIVYFYNGRFEGVDRFDIGLNDYLSAIEIDDIKEGIKVLSSTQFFPKTHEDFDNNSISHNFQKIKKVHFDWVDKINSIKEHRKFKKENTQFVLMGLESHIKDFNVFMNDYFEMSIVIPIEGWRESHFIGTGVGMHY